MTIIVILFFRLKEFDLSHAKITNITFSANHNLLHGSLVLPKNVDSPPIALIVHGDGAQDRFSNSTYLPLINTLLDKGIGVFTWDKPGIGQSNGDWLKQAMKDRSNEVLTAYKKIKSLPISQNSSIGILGFSQAGWVIPIANNKIKPSFSVIIGGAVNWRHQGAYYTKSQLEKEGLNPEKVKKEVASNLKINDAIFGNPNLSNPKLRPDMSVDRFNFVLRNYNSDATPYLDTMNGPVLAIWGENDKNVSPIYNQNIYKQNLNKDKNQKTVIIKNATHGLLNSKWFNYQTNKEWPIWKESAFIFLGRYSYASHSLNLIGNWIQEVTKKSKKRTKIKVKKGVE